MGADDKIQEAIRILAGSNLADNVYAVDCTVISVDEDARTAQVQAIGGKARNTFTARLMTTVDDGVLVVPEDDSTVCVVFGNFTKPYITQYSGVKKIVLRGGDLGGLVKVIELTTKLNNLENLVNDLVQKFNSHVHTGVTAGGASTGPTPTQETTTLVKTKRKDIENEQITHG